MIEEKRLKLGAWNINYMVVGNGPHVVLCMPGTLGTIMSNFAQQIAGFDREQFTLVLWDPPGNGQSRPPENDFCLDFYENNADSAHEFMKVLQIPKYSVLGWCGGGRSSIIMAAKHPEIINKMVIWGVNSFITPGELEMFKKYRDIRRWARHLREPLIELYGEEYLAKYWSKFVDGLSNIYDVREGKICSHFLKDVRCPTFILYGERDILVDAIHAPYLRDHIKNSRMHIYPEGKHDIHIKLPDDFNRRVQDFLLESSTT